jgi:hypothetical protein
VTQQSKPAPQRVSTHTLIAQAFKKIKDVERPTSTQSRRDVSDDELLSMIEE